MSTDRLALFALLALALATPACEDSALAVLPDSMRGGGGGGDDDDDWDTSEPPDEDEAPPEDVEDDLCEGAPVVPTTVYMSADDSNSMGSASLARHQINHGVSSPDRITVHEFLNYYDFDFPAADPGEVRVEAQLRPDPSREGAYSVLVSAVSEARTVDTRPPLNVVFSLDSSCSMGGQAMEMSKAVMENTAASLREGDLVSIVKWSSGTAVQLNAHEVTGPFDETLLAAIAATDTSGGTDLSAGLQAAFDVAARNHTDDRLSRVVLLSDGGANLGTTDATLIGANADDSESAGIYMVGVGAGSPREYRHDLMDTVTDLGKGAYLYIDSADEAERQFRGDRFVSNLDVAALDVRLAVELPAGFVIDDFHGEEMSADPADVEPQHLAPNDSMQYHFTLQDCPEGIAQRDETFRFTLTWTDPVTRQERSTERALLLSDLLDGDVRQVVKADAVIEYAQAMVDLATLRGQARHTRLEDAAAAVDAAVASFPDDPDLAEIASLLTTLRQTQ